MSFDPLKGAMIGAGRFARFQAEAWRRVEGARIVAVADAAPGRAEEFSERFGIPRAYRDAAEMLERERPDFVDIVTRPDSHLELVRLAARCGAGVICQKPMAPNWEECAAMVNVCADANVRLLIHENWRWQPWYREVKRLLDQGAVGRPFYASFVMRNSTGAAPNSTRRSRTSARWSGCWFTKWSYISSTRSVFCWANSGASSAGWGASTRRSRAKITR